MLLNRRYRPPFEARARSKAWSLCWRSALVAVIVWQFPPALIFAISAVLAILAALTAMTLSGNGRPRW